MKIKSGYLLREVAGQRVVIPIGQRVSEFNGVMTLSESGAFLWDLLSNDRTREDLINALCERYQIDHALASADVDDFLSSLTAGDVLIN